MITVGENRGLISNEISFEGYTIIILILIVYKKALTMRRVLTLEDVQEGQNIVRSSSGGDQVSCLICLAKASRTHGITILQQGNQIYGSYLKYIKQRSNPLMLILLQPSVSRRLIMLSLLVDGHNS